MNDMPHVAVVQLGARNHYLAATMLHKHGMLQGLYTDAYALHNSWRLALTRQLVGRRSDLRQRIDARRAQLPDDKVKAAWSITLMAMLCKRLTPGGNRTARIDARLSRMLTSSAIRGGVEGATAVIGYSSACPELFAYVRKKGIKTILDQASATVKVSERIIKEELRVAAGWSLSGPPEMELYAARERAELNLADLVLAPSEFVRSSLLEIGVPEKRIEVVPYGYRVEQTCRLNPKQRSGPLKVLFLGNVHLQKGIRHFLEATKFLSPQDFQFRVVGRQCVAADKLEPYRTSVDFVGGVARSDVASHYSWADVFVMPTLCDGFGIVQLEAASYGLPMIVTGNCGDVIRDGIDGFVVRAADAHAIANRLELFEKNHEMFEKFSQAIRQRAYDFSEKCYGERLTGAICELMAR